ncbi:MAG: hypothetical protein GXO32_08225 [Crenarchaeota archaeon]|nr:hypothetical protein [Thermoproteota archaeon]
MSFARYAAIVKNLRGVIAAHLDEDGCEESIKWLAARFRYRDLGVGPTLLARYRSKLERYLGKPLRQLVYPVSELERFANELGRALGLEETAAEALVLASTYISPLIAIGRQTIAVYEKLAAAKVLTDLSSMKVQDWKLHLRIADYTVLDFYEQCVTESIELLRSGLVNAEKIVEERRSRISSDIKRYWRISRSQGEPFLLYIDMLRVSLSILREKEFSENVAAALAIVPVVCVPPGMR